MLIAANMRKRTGAIYGIDGRNLLDSWGKRRQIVTTILEDLDLLKDGSAIKVPLAELVESKEKVRSALNRATRKAGRTVATASDASFLYVWNVSASRQKPLSSN